VPQQQMQGMEHNPELRNLLQQLQKQRQQLSSARFGSPELDTMLQQVFGQASPTAGEQGQMPSFGGMGVSPSHRVMANFSPGSTATGITRPKRTGL
jgi:hypothetical protein